MEIHLLLSGEQFGPFSMAQVRQYLNEGRVSRSDLAFVDGMENWQSLDLVFAQSSLVDLDADSKDQVSEPAFSFIMDNKTFDANDVTCSSSPPEALLPLTASQKTKRKLSKIVVQPILPLEPSTPIRKKSQTGKTALKLEPLRPTTALLPVPERLPEEKTAAPPTAVTAQVAPDYSPEKPLAPPTLLSTSVPVSEPPPAEVSRFLPPPDPILKPAEIGARTFVLEAWFRRIPRWIVYAGVAGMALLVGFIVFFFFLPTEKDSSPVMASTFIPEIVVPQQNQVEAPTAESAPQTAAEFSARGFARQAKSDLDGAIADYNQALVLEPNNVEALYRRALARQAQGAVPDALADYTQVLSLDPKRADAYSSRGYIKQAQGDLDGAVADYNQALVINPKISGDYYNVGLIEVQKGELDRAIAAYDHALDLDPKMAVAFYNRGVAKNTEGNLDGAIADFTQALALNPNIASAYCDRGTARQSKGDFDGALADYTQALALNPKMADAFYNRGLIKMQKGDLDGAVADNTEAINLDAKNGQAYGKRGLALFGKGSLDEALADLKQFYVLAPRDSGADIARLYIWLISRQEYPQHDADAELSTSLLNDWNSPPEDLTSKIGAFLLGHISEDELIADAASPDPGREPGQYCKVWYFAGMKRLLSGDMTTATSYFQKCLATNQKDNGEYLFAQAELRTLGQKREVAAKPEARP